MNEVKDADNDIDKYKLAFIGSNRKKFNFNIFRMPLNFLSAIYNDEISLKEAEISQGNLEKKRNELKYRYKPIIEAFRDGTFSFEYLKILILLTIMC